MGEDFIGVVDGLFPAGLGSEFGFRRGCEALIAIFDLHITEEVRVIGEEGGGIEE